MRSWLGINPDDMPENLRPLVQMYGEAAHRLGADNDVSKDMNLPGRSAIKNADLQELQRLKGMLPDAAAREEMKKALYRKQPLYEGWDHWGMNLIEQRDARLSKLMEDRGIQNTEENRGKVLKDLIEGVRTQQEYDPNSLLFDPENADTLDENAHQILNIWSMENLNTKFDTAKELRNQFGEYYDEQTKLQKDYEDLLSRHSAENKPKEIRNIVLNGKVVGAVPRFGEFIDSQLATATTNELARTMFGNKTDRKLLDLYARGATKQKDQDQLLRAFGNSVDVTSFQQNAFAAEADALPSESYVPMTMTPDGRMAFDKDGLQQGVYLALYDQELQRMGVEDSSLSEAELQEVRDKVWRKTKMHTEAMLDDDALMVNIDPDDALRSFLDKEGFRGGALKLAEAVTTITTLGRKEKFFNNLPDRVIKGLLAMTLPRRAGGIVTEGGEEIGFVREGELFAGPTLGNNAATNSMDYLLRVFGLLDEPVTRSFALAVDDEAKSKQPDSKGRPLRIVKRMVENFGTDRHVAFITADAHAGGRFLTEFGDAFINPLLGDYGEENPGLGTALGAVAAMAFFIYTPSALELGSLGATGTKLAGKKVARYKGLTDKSYLAAGARGMLKVLDTLSEKFKAPGKASSMDEIKEADAAIEKAAKLDRTGAVATYSLLAAAGTLMNHGLAANLREKAVLRMSKMYGGLKNRRDKQLRAAKEAEDAAKKRQKDGKRTALTLRALKHRIEAASEGIKAEKIITDSLTKVANSDEIERALSEVLTKSNKAEDADFIADAFAFLRSDLDEVGDIDLFLQKHKLVPDGVKLSDDAGLRVAQIRSLVADKFKKIMDDTPDAKAIVGRSEFASAILKSQGVVLNLAKEINLLEKMLRKYTADVEILTKNGLAPKHVLASFTETLQKYGGRIQDLLDDANEQKEYLERLAKRKKTLKTATDAEIEQMALDSYNEYLDRLRSLVEGAVKVTDLSEDQFEMVMKATYGKGHEAFAKGLIEGDTDEARKLSEVLMPTGAANSEEAALEVSKRLFETKTLARILNDPFSEIQLTIRAGVSPIDFFRDVRAWKIFTVLNLTPFLRRYPVFTTNIRFLEATVRRELDDAAKDTARRTQNVMDSLNLIYKHVEDPDLADKLARELLEGTSKFIDIEAKYKVPFTKSNKLSLTAIADRSESLMDTFVDRVLQMRDAKKKAGKQQVGDTADMGLRTAIKAFLNDKTLLRSDIVEDVLKIEADVAEALYEARQAGAVITVKYLTDEILMKAVQKQGLEFIRNTEGAIGKRSQTLLYRGIIVGAAQEDFLKRVFNIIGPRFSSNMARAMNYMMGQGGEAVDKFAAKNFEVGDIVVMREYNRNYNALVDDVLIRSEKDDFGKPKRDVFGKEQSVRPFIIEREVDPNFKLTGQGVVPKPINTDPSWAARVEAKRQYYDVEKLEYKRAPKVEEKLMELSGDAGFQIKKIDPDGTVHLMDMNSKELTTKTMDEIVYRDTSVSILDAIDGFSIWGIEMMDNLGRSKATENMRGARTAYQKMVAIGTGEGGDLRMVPESILTPLIESLTNIEKELDTALSTKAAEGGLARINLLSFKKVMRWWKTHILTGLIVPRPAYFMNQLFGDFSQMFVTAGPQAAAGLTFMGSLAYVPVFGNALQESYFQMMARLPAGKIPLPGMFSSMFNNSMAKILKGSNELSPVKGADGEFLTFNQLRGEAVGAGVRDNIMSPETGQAAVEALRRTKELNPTLWQKLADGGQNLKYMQELTQLKIHHVQTRQRLLLYLHLRINKAMSADDARKGLHNSLYDWTYSVGRHEMASIGRLALFYTLSKNAMGQVFRTFFEHSNVGTKEYMRRYARGQTQLQRVEGMARLQSSFPGAPNPFEELSPEEQRIQAELQFRPDYFAEYPFMSFDALSEEAQQIMTEGGFLRNMYGRSLPKSTIVEYMTQMFDIIGSLSALAAASGLTVVRTATGTEVIPVSIDSTAATAQLFESTIDQFMVPMYGDVASNFAVQYAGLKDVKQSEYGRRVRPGDLALAQIMGFIGGKDLITITADPQDPRQKRIGFKGGMITDMVMNIPRVELHRARMIMSIAFPGMAPSEIRALAAEDGPTRARLEALANIMNVGKVLMFNGNNNRYWELDEIRDRVRVIERKNERIAMSAIVPED